MGRPGGPRPGVVASGKLHPELRDVSGAARTPYKMASSGASAPRMSTPRERKEPGAAAAEPRARMAPQPPSEDPLGMWNKYHKSGSARLTPAKKAPGQMTVKRGVQIAKPDTSHMTHEEKMRRLEQQDI